MIKKGQASRWRTEDQRLCTNTRKGLSHGNAPVRGCVTRTPIGKEGRRTLWLEYAKAKGTKSRPDDDQILGLVWQETSGKPRTPQSAVFRRQDLQSLLNSLLEYVPR